VSNFYKTIEVPLWEVFIATMKLKGKPTMGGIDSKLKIAPKLTSRRAITAISKKNTGMPL
jgi:hypothetical protein